MSLKKLENLSFFLTILLLPTQLGRHFWPNFSFIYSLKIDYLSPTIYLWDILILIVLTTFLLQKKKLNKLSLNLLGFFILLQLTSLLGAQNVGAGLVRLEQYLIIGFWGVYISSKKFKEIKYSLVWGVALSVFYVCVIALLEVILAQSLNIWILGERSFNLYTPSIATFNFLGSVFLRPYASFPHPNVLAGFLLISAVLIYFLVKNFRLLLMFCFIIIILSFSRTAILIAFIESLIILRKKIIFFLAIFVIALPFLFIRYSSAFNFDYLSVIRREQLVEIGLIDFRNSPIIGVGLNNFINQTAQSNLIVGSSRFFQPLHNIVLLTLAETGLVGLSGFVVLVGYPIFLLLRKFRERLSQMLLLNWMIIFFLGMFDHYFLTLGQGQRLFFLIWGLSMLKLSDGDFRESI